MGKNMGFNFAFTLKWKIDSQNVDYSPKISHVFYHRPLKVNPFLP